MAKSFFSELDARRFLRSNEVSLLGLADACTRRVPRDLRRAPVLPPPVLVLPGDPAMAFAKVFWNGRHKTWGWGSPLGKLHRQGVQVLESRGWRRVEVVDERAAPAFCWSTRNAGDFPAHGVHAVLPLVRPFPQQFTDCLDSKRELATHLAAAGQQEIAPETWLAEEFLVSGPREERGAQPSIWFLKHASGVKGNSVFAHAGTGTLLQQLEELGRRSQRMFVVQRGVAPPALRNGRKWTLRVHAVLHGDAVGGLTVYCHRDMILQEHHLPFSMDVHRRSVHISTAAAIKHLPKPSLLDDGALAEEVRTLMARTFAAVWQHAPRGPYSPVGAELCQVFGCDVVVDEAGRAWLIEVNSYPAICSGTMAEVESSVYTALVRDVLGLVVLPRLDGLPPMQGGFDRLEVECWLNSDGRTGATA